MKIFLIILCLFLIDLNNAAVLWNYYDLGPDVWKVSYPVCEGENQSPIDINTATTTYDPNLKDFNLTQYNDTHIWTFRNTGQNTNVNPGSSNIAMSQRDTPLSIISGGNFNYTFRLIQMHIHWGYNDYSGSEHTINGVKYPAEIHLVNADSNNNLLMFGFIFQLSEQNNTKLTDFINTIDAVPLPTNRKNLTFAVGSILPTADEISSQGYFQYLGSLTLPPCSEGVIWVMFNAKIDISSEQLKVFRKNAFLSNWREPQLLYNRTVYSSKNLSTTSTTTQANVKNNLGVFGMMNIFLWNIF